MALSLQLCIEGQHPGVTSSMLMLRLGFCGYYLMKLPVEDLWGVCFSNVLVLLICCAPGPPTPLSILVRTSLRCSVRGVVHSVVQDLQFLSNFSRGMAFISQNNNRLTFQKKVICFWIFWACNRTHKCWCSRYSTSLKKASFNASLIRTTDFSCANIIAKGFSSDQFTFLKW